MIPPHKNTQFPAAFNEEKVGKVFVVVSDNLRGCHICDQLFTREESYEHSMVTCYPRTYFC